MPEPSETKIIPNFAKLLKMLKCDSCRKVSNKTSLFSRHSKPISVYTSFFLGLVPLIILNKTTTHRHRCKYRKSPLIRRFPLASSPSSVTSQVLEKNPDFLQEKTQKNLDQENMYIV